MPIEQEILNHWHHRNIVHEVKDSCQKVNCGRCGISNYIHGFISHFVSQLIPFLHDKNPQVRQIALANLLGHTTKESPHRKIFLDGLKTGGLQGIQDNDIICSLKLLCRDHLVTYFFIPTWPFPFIFTRRRQLMMPSGL